jgi:hypothetical protein
VSKLDVMPGKRKTPEFPPGSSDWFLDQEILEHEANASAEQVLAEVVAAVEPAVVTEETEAAADAVLNTTTNVTVALATIAGPGRAAASHGVRSEVQALDRETTDELTLEVVNCTEGAVATDASTEGVVDTNTDVLREEVGKAETAAEGAHVVVVRAAWIVVVTSSADESDVNLVLTSAEELILRSYDNFLGSGTGERGRCGGHYDCKECKGFVHVYLGLWLY